MSRPKYDRQKFDEDVLPVAVVRLRGELVSIDESTGKDADSNDTPDPIPPQLLPAGIGGVSMITAAVSVIAAAAPAPASPFEWARTAPGAVSSAGSTFGSGGTGSIVLSLTDSSGNLFNGDDSGLDATSGNRVYL